LVGHANTPILFHHGYQDPYIPLAYARLSYNIIKAQGLETYQVHVEEGLKKHDMTPSCLLILSAMIAQNSGIDLDYLDLPEEAPLEAPPKVEKEQEREVPETKENVVSTTNTTESVKMN
jgi:hypothetical protein